MLNLFSVVLSLSVSGALVGLLILLFRPICGRFFTKRWTYYLWLLVIARLLVPIHADLNLMEYLAGNLAEVGSVLADAVGQDNAGGVTDADAAKMKEMAEQNNANAVANTDAVKMEGISGQDNVNAVTNTDAVRNEGSVVQNSISGVEMISASGMNSGAGAGIWERCLQVAAVIWILGVFFTALRKLWLYRCFVRNVCAGSVETGRQRQLSNGELRTACVPVTDERILWQYAEIQRKLRIGRRVPLYESVGTDIPMLIGFWQPRIYLPQALLAEMTGRENDICLILHHELVHYKRKDIWYKWLFQAALCVHWFNPLVYLFSHKFNVDCELACDETVLKLLSEEGRRAYGNVLLDVAQKDWSEGAFSGKALGTRGNVPAMTLLEEKSTLKERLRGIARYHKTGLAVGLCSAVVLVMFLAVAVVCGAAGIRGGSGRSLLLQNSGSGLIERFWEKSLWSEMWKDSFDLAQPIVVSSNGTAYRMYDDDALIAGDSESDCWRAWMYTGGDRRVDVKKFAFNGSESLWILYANKETTLEISSVFNLYDGRFKLVWVGPDQTVQTLNESGEESTVKLTLPQGRNVIKMVGQKAKLIDLGVAYGKIKTGDFDGIYQNEASEYGYLVLEGKQPFDLLKLKEAYPYLKEKEVSELSRMAWEDGTELSKKDWQELFIYSDDNLTAQYLLEALQAGKVGKFDSGILIEIAPYMQAADVSECFRYLLERDAVLDSDWENIFVYSDANQSAKYLSEALRKGKGKGFSDKALERICYQVSVKKLTDIVTAMDELSFESLERVLAYVQDMDEAATCVCHYIDLGNVLTDEQLRRIEAYLNEEDFYRVVNYNKEKNL